MLARHFPLLDGAERTLAAQPAEDQTAPPAQLGPSPLDALLQNAEAADDEHQEDEGEGKHETVGARGRKKVVRTIGIAGALTVERAWEVKQ